MTDLATMLEGTDPIVAEAAPAATVLVSFGGLAMRPGMPPGEFLGASGGLGASRVFVRDPFKCFYQQGLPGAPTWPDIVEQIRPHLAGYERVVFIGNSAGASAALLAAMWLQPRSVLAFAPVTFLDRRRRLRHRDRRWPEEVRRARKGTPAQRRYADVGAALAAGPAVDADVYYGRDMRLDALHAERLPGVRLQARPGDSHDLIKELRDSGELRAMLARAVDAEGA